MVALAVGEEGAGEEHAGLNGGRVLLRVLLQHHDDRLVLGGDSGLDVPGAVGNLLVGRLLEELDAEERDAVARVDGGLPHEVGLGLLGAAVAREEADEFVVHRRDQRAVGEVPEP